MKRKMAMLLAAAAIAGSIAGCGGNGVESAENAQIDSVQEQETIVEETASDDAKQEKTVIEYWHCNAETQGGLTVEELVDKFNAENDHIEVVAKYNPDMYKGLMQNLQAEAAVGNSPAVVQIGWAFLTIFPIISSIQCRRTL